MRLCSRLMVVFFFEEVELNLEASDLLIERAHLFLLLSQLFGIRAKNFGEHSLAIFFQALI
jgi:hypothetical protein